MHIVIEASRLFRDGQDIELKRYFADCLTLLIRDKPQVRFTLISAGIFSPEELTRISVETIEIRNRFPGNFGRIFTRFFQVPARIRELNPDLILSLGSTGPGRLKTPRAAWIPHPFATGYAGPRKSARHSDLKEKDVLLTGALSNATELAVGFSIPREQIVRVPLAYDENYQAPSWPEKENIKVKYAGGKEYFITRAFLPEKNQLDLLKAFSQFKRKQQSNMQLLIAGMKGEWNKAPYEKLESFKYRSDVHVYSRLPEKEYLKLVTAAYASIYPVDWFPGNMVLNALFAQVPVIICGEPDMDKELTAVLHVHPPSIEGLAEQMIRLFKDENLRTDLVQKGKIQVAAFTLQQSVTSLWNGMMKTLRD